MKPLAVGVTGLNATDNPAPGVAVIRAIRKATGPSCRIIGLAYDPLDTGNYMDGIADQVFLMPYPSEGGDVLLDRLTEIHHRSPIDVLIPNLDSELSLYVKLTPALAKMGIKTFLPSESQLKTRAKAKLGELKSSLGINVPKSKAISESSAILKLDEQFDFPVMVKGQFYEALIAYSPMEVERHFQHLRAKWGVPIIVQEFITGQEYDVAAVGDGLGSLVGAVPMRKMQLTEMGKAWGGITVADPALSEFVADAMAKLAWQGPCELEVIKAKEDGRFYLLEINPRFPAWVYLAVGAERNLPWATVQLALGKEVTPLPPPQAGIMFLRHSYDQICTLSDYESLAIRGELCRDEVPS